MKAHGRTTTNLRTETRPIATERGFGVDHSRPDGKKRPCKGKGCRKYLPKDRAEYCCQACYKTRRVGKSKSGESRTNFAQGIQVPTDQEVIKVLTGTDDGVPIYRVPAGVRYTEWGMM